jgi:hypothetical protein
MGAAFLLVAPTADADKQGFVDYIHSQGVPPAYFGTPGADYGNVKAAEMVCDVFHNGGTPADIPFLGLQQNNYREVIINGAAFRVPRYPALPSPLAMTPEPLGEQ